MCWGLLCSGGCVHTSLSHFCDVMHMAACAQQAQRPHPRVRQCCCPVSAAHHTMLFKQVGCWRPASGRCCCKEHWQLRWCRGHTCTAAQGHGCAQPGTVPGGWRPAHCCLMCADISWCSHQVWARKELATRCPGIVPWWVRTVCSIGSRLGCNTAHLCSKDWSLRL
jgi:hypothetical protein